LLEITPTTIAGFVTLFHYLSAPLPGCGTNTSTIEDATDMWANGTAAFPSETQWPSRMEVALRRIAATA